VARDLEDWCFFEFQECPHSLEKKMRREMGGRERECLHQLRQVVTPHRESQDEEKPKKYTNEVLGEGNLTQEPKDGG
jgi:hypothetical protein